LDVFLECAFRIGSKTYVHTAKVITKLLPAFQRLCNTPEARAHVVEFVASLWVQNPKMLTISLGYATLDNESLIYSVFHVVAPCLFWLQTHAILLSSTAWPYLLWESGARRALGMRW